MAEELTAGWFPKDPEEIRWPNTHAGVIRVFAWQAPQFAQSDREIGGCAKLEPLKSIIVERYASNDSIGRVSLKWSDGTLLHTYQRRDLSQRVQRAIQRAITETYRIAGGKRGR
jgi:hypothetical protein